MENLGAIRDQVIALNKKQTNADRIRAMTDEELAEWLRDFGDCDGLNRRCKGFGKCKECWLDWLRQEEDTNGN